LVYPLRIDVDSNGATANAERGDEMRSGAAERIDDDLVRSRPVFERRRNESDGLRCRVIDTLLPSLTRPHGIHRYGVVSELSSLLRRRWPPVEDRLPMRQER